MMIGPTELKKSTLASAEHPVPQAARAHMKEEPMMADTQTQTICWNGPNDRGHRLLPVSGTEDLWALGPVDIRAADAIDALIVVVEGPEWTAAALAERCMPCIPPWEKPWRVKGIVIASDARPPNDGYFHLSGSVADLISREQHWRLEERPYPGVTVSVVGTWDALEQARCHAYHWIQQEIPEGSRRSFPKLYQPPT